jgi:hypothetical protein
MPLLFRKIESTSRKWAAIAIFSSFGLAIYGIINRGNYVASPSNPFFLIGFPIALGLISTAYFYKDPHPENKLVNLGLRTRIILIPSLAAFMSGMFWASIGIGVPLAHTQITGARLIVEAAVIEKLPEHSGKGCHYRVLLNSKEIKTNTYTCVSQEIWTSTKAGDRLIAELRVGILGTYLSTLRPE